MIDEHMRTDLVQDDLQMALTLRDELPGKVVFPDPDSRTNRAGVGNTSMMEALRRPGRSSPP